ncbi:MAG: hypothetical protein ACLS4Z_10220 [Christensenellaceae bacterium]
MHGLAELEQDEMEISTTGEIERSPDSASRFHHAGETPPVTFST